MKKSPIAFGAALIAVTLLVPTAHAQEAPSPRECEALRLGLPLIVSITPETTKSNLQAQLDAKGNIISAFFNNAEGLKLLKAKTTSDISKKAQDCGLVKPDPVEGLLGSIGSSQLATYLPMLRSLSS